MVKINFLDYCIFFTLSTLSVNTVARTSHSCGPIAFTAVKNIVLEAYAVAAVFYYLDSNSLLNWEK